MKQQNARSSLGQVDEALRRLLEEPVSPDILTRVRSALEPHVHQPPPEQQVLTLDEVAALLRLDERQLDEILDELPAFEMAGQIRVRRVKLDEWMEKRERQYLAECLQSRTARMLKNAFSRGVA